MIDNENYYVPHDLQAQEIEATQGVSKSRPSSKSRGGGFYNQDGGVETQEEIARVVRTTNKQEAISALEDNPDSTVIFFEPSPGAKLELKPVSTEISLANGGTRNIIEIVDPSWGTIGYATKEFDLDILKTKEPEVRSEGPGADAWLGKTVSASPHPFTPETASTIASPEEAGLSSEKIREAIGAAVQLVGEYPQLRVLMPGHNTDNFPREGLYAVPNAELSADTVSGGTYIIYTESNEPVMVTADPTEYTNEIRKTS